MKNPKELTLVKTPEGVLTAVILPQYILGEETMEDADGTSILFCKGTKETPIDRRQAGVFTESLLQASLEYLQNVNTGSLQNLNTTEAIQHIKAALGCLDRRHQKRQENGTQFTSKEG